MRGCWALVVVVLALASVNGQGNEGPDTTPDPNDVRRPPSINTGPKGHVVYKSENKEIACVADGFPQPQGEDYVWTINGETFDVGVYPNVKRHTDPTVGTIIFDPMYQLNEGYYQCIANNVHGKAVSDVVFMQAAVMGDPDTEGDVKIYNVDEGDPLVVQCDYVKSVPNATYSWVVAVDRVDDAPFPVDMNARVNVDDTGNLFFSHAVPADAKEGKLYKCNVNNAFLDNIKGGSYSTVTVRAGSASVTSPSLTFHSDAKMIALIGHDISLRCMFEGKPEANVEWSKIGGNLPIGRYKYAKSQTELILQRIEWGDEGTYRCTGKSTAGQATGEIYIEVEESPVFRTIDSRPHNINATDEDDVSFLCDARGVPETTIKWYINGKEFDEGSHSRMKLSADRKNLTITSVCKSCLGGSDLQNVQCNASNTHGYAYSSGYLNVVNPTTITDAPKSHEHVYHEDIVFECKAVSDASTPVHINWYHEDRKIEEKQGEIEIDDDWTLTIKTEHEPDGGLKYRGAYTCEATNGYSHDRATAELDIPEGPLPVKSGFMDNYWWIFIIIAVILLLLILLLCCCLFCQRNRGETYPVDEKERKNGNDPEKELADNGYRDYQRPEEVPIKGSRASLSSTIKLGDSDDEGSLAEYGDIDPGKFNEDGSFIGQYVTDKKKQPAESDV